MEELPDTRLLVPEMVVAAARAVHFLKYPVEIQTLNSTIKLFVNREMTVCCFEYKECV